ncbi:MAG: diphosphate--fructose-6-phosphate 1-phosphotransferase, partial [Mesorhizobium sp.]
DKPDAAYCEVILNGLKKAGADAFIYIGGNDTSGTQQILTDAAGGAIAFVHAPKTIDNDLEENDHTPGFISAAEFVAGAFLSVDLDFRALPGIYVGIVMGRHAGFLTAAAAAWQLDPDSGPHLVYVPERAFSAERFIDDVRRTLDRHKRCIVAVSEGVSTADGKALVESLVPPEKLERDQHGNVKLSGSDLPAALERALAEGLPGKRARVDALGYMPRGYVGAISPVDAKEAFEAGAFAVAVAGEGGGSVALQYDGTKTVLKKVPLEAVAGKTRHMPDNFMKPDVNQLSEAGMAYLKRLVPEKYKVGKPFV